MKTKITDFLKHNWLFITVIALVIVYFAAFDQYYVQTGSMEPTLRVGAIAITNPRKTPEVGDICAYRSGSNIVIHRVIDITEDGFITKGDNNSTPDSRPVKEDQIMGTVVLRVNFVAPLIKKILRL